MDRAELARRLGHEPAFAEPREVELAEGDPARFMAAFGEAVAAGGRVFLADPGWGARERAQLAALRALPPPADAAGWLAIPTGGSSGNLKLARHDEGTLGAAVLGFSAAFGPGPVNAVGLLPLHHVSGLMAWLRCVLTGGTYVPWEARRLLTGDRPPLGAGAWFISLVPTQLARLLAEPAAVAWLRGFRAVFVGGGPAWPELRAAGRAAGLPLSFTYGMTETAAMVTALMPEAFLAGAEGSGRPLPHAQVTLDPEGRIVVAGESLFRGYYPDGRRETAWATEDLGRWDEQGSLHVLGRRDGFIITGGEKVDPLEVETVLRSTGAFADVAVIGVADAQWGERVVACYPANTGTPDLSRVMPALEGALAPFKRPKAFVAVKDWPRNAQGKLNRAALHEAAASA